MPTSASAARTATLTGAPVNARPAEGGLVALITRAGGALVVSAGDAPELAAVDGAAPEEDGDVTGDDAGGVTGEEAGGEAGGDAGGDAGGASATALAVTQLEQLPFEEVTLFDSTTKPFAKGSSTVAVKVIAAEAPEATVTSCEHEVAAADPGAQDHPSPGR